MSLSEGRPRAPRRNAHEPPRPAASVEPAPGDELILRTSEERVRVVAVLDGAGTLLVRAGEDEFEASRDELEWPWRKHAGCSCCGSLTR